MDRASVNIFLIDDDEGIIYTYRNILNEQGYKVKAFSISTEALKNVTRKGTYFYNSILMVIQVPRINGIQLYYRFKSIDPNAKTSQITAINIESELVESMPGIDI